MHISLIMFVATVVTIVFLQSYSMKHGYNRDWTISRYMGTSAWSAILFAVSNFVISAFMVKYFWAIKKALKLSKFWFTAIIIMVISFVMLSVCPVGLFDATWGDYGVVSHIHRGSSYVLFFTMFLTAIGSLIEIKNKNNLFTAFGSFLLAYSTFAIYGYICKPAFYMDNIIYFEFFYIVFNLFFYGLMPLKKHGDLGN